MQISVRENLDRNTVIRRYLGLSSFLELLAGRLYVGRADTFNDAQEGWHIDRERASITSSVLEWLSLSPTREVEGFVRPRLPHEVVFRARQRAFLSCWVEGSTESFAMWNIYGRQSEAVAISSTVGNLADMFGSEEIEWLSEAHIGRVSYEKINAKIKSPADFFFSKRCHFEFEKEIRAVLLTPFCNQYMGVAYPVHHKQVGAPVFFAPDLSKLINAVTVGPDTRDTLREAVETALTYVTGSPLKIPVRKSTLDFDSLPIPIDPES